ncbi:MAG TPA: amidohydrolase family protein [Chloroflexota bacterium]|nr:amidohydrolase family protein [Chloroflexota bacterium]
MIVDVHMHIFGGLDWNPAACVQGMSRLWARLVRWSGEQARPEHYLDVVAGIVDPDGSKCIAQMDEVGIDVSIMMPMDRGYIFPDQQIPIDEMNRRCGEIAGQHLGRLYTFCGVDPRRADAVELFRRGVLEHGAIGLKLYPPCGFYPNDPLCYRLYEAALALDVPVLIHTGYAVPPLKSKYAHPLYIDDPTADLPELRVILGHSGMPHAWAADAISLAIYRPNVYLDLSLWYGWQDEAELVKSMLLMRDRVGIDRILFGTDRTGARPSEHLRGWIDQLRALPETAARHGETFTQREVDLILGVNAARLLRLPGMRNEE